MNLATDCSLKLCYSGDFAPPVQLEAYSITRKQIFNTRINRKMNKGFGAIIHFDESIAIEHVNP